MAKTLDFKLSSKWYRRSVGSLEIVGGLVMMLVPSRSGFQDTLVKQTRIGVAEGQVCNVGDTPALSALSPSHPGSPPDTRIGHPDTHVGYLTHPLDRAAYHEGARTGHGAPNHVVGDSQSGLGRCWPWRPTLFPHTLCNTATVDISAQGKHANVRIREHRSSSQASRSLLAPSSLWL